MAWEELLATKCQVSVSNLPMQKCVERAGGLTALRLPAPGLRTSRLPGPMLLLRDFLRLAARVPVLAPTSIVAFSLSFPLLLGDCAPIDLRVLRVAGKVTSPPEAIATRSSVSYGLVDAGVLSHLSCVASICGCNTGEQGFALG